MVVPFSSEPYASLDVSVNAHLLIRTLTCCWTGDVLRLGGNVGYRGRAQNHFVLLKPRIPVELRHTALTPDCVGIPGNLGPSTHISDTALTRS
jgi:hypothetical protein